MSDHDDDQHVHVHFHFDEPITINLQSGGQGQGVTLDDIAASINELRTDIMQDFTALTAAVAAQKTVADSAITLLNGINARIAALSPTQAAIDDLTTQVTAETAALAAGVVAGTGAPDVPPTVPVVTP